MPFPYDNHDLTIMGGWAGEPTPWGLARAKKNTRKGEIVYAEIGKTLSHQEDIPDKNYQKNYDGINWDLLYEDGMAPATEADMAKKIWNHVGCVELVGVRRAKDGEYGFPASWGGGRCETCGKVINKGDRITAGGQPKKGNEMKVEMRLGGETLQVEGNKAQEFSQAIVAVVPEGAKADDVTTAAGLLAQALAAAVAASPELEARIAKLEARAPITNTIVLHAVTDTKVDVGLTHEAFEQILFWVRLGLHVWLTGPCASGKTTLAEQIAKALGRDFVFDGARWDAYGLSGYMNAQGVYVRTNFRDAYEHGKIYLLDEADACEPAAMLWLNGALANGMASFPDGMIKRHPDFVCLCAANTWGHGATTEYVGRLKQDAAFLDRFVQVPVNYDEKLERAMSGNDAWVDRVIQVRKAVAARGLKIVVSPRISKAGAMALANGMAWADAEKHLLAAKMTPEQWQSVK